MAVKNFCNWHKGLIWLSETHVFFVSRFLCFISLLISWTVLMLVRDSLYVIHHKCNAVIFHSITSAVSMNTTMYSHCKWEDLSSAVLTFILASGKTSSLCDKQCFDWCTLFVISYQIFYIFKCVAHSHITE